MDRFYAVKIGRRPGVYTTWRECQEQVEHYPGSKFMGFKSFAEAVDWAGIKPLISSVAPNATPLNIATVDLTLTGGLRPIDDDSFFMDVAEVQHPPPLQPEPISESLLSPHRRDQKRMSCPGPSSSSPTIIPPPHLPDDPSASSAIQQQNIYKSTSRPPKRGRDSGSPGCAGSSSLVDKKPKVNLQQSTSSRQEVYEVSDDSEDTDDDVPIIADTKPVIRELEATSSDPEEASPSGSEPVLSVQQSKVLQKVLDGQNCFFTGPAGTGKSVLLRAIISAFKNRDTQQDSGHDDESDDMDGDRRGQPVIHGGAVKKWKLAVTASTGMAGVNIGGSTVHSWAGIGLGLEPSNVLATKIFRNKQSRERWQTTGAIVIDEISMIEGTLLDKLDEVGRLVRRVDRPFGGIQVILTGDFFQLPPVTKGKPPTFAFEAKCWPELFTRSNMTSLTQVFRQKDDRFVDVLASMRRGEVGPENERLLRSLDRPIKYPDGVEPVSLYPHKKDVELINNNRLNAIPEEPTVYDAYDEPGKNVAGYPVSSEQATTLLNRNTIWPQELALKPGAQVMLITNLGDGVLVNGSTGTVVNFLTLQQASADPEVTIPPCQLGRVRWDTEFPVVEFAPSRYAREAVPKKVVIPSLSIEALNAMGKTEATRIQVPLILAWALTIHKSQGQTIERIKVDLRNIFVEGQTYVAISRAVSLEGLEINNFEARKVRAHQKVIRWASVFEAQQAEDEEWNDVVDLLSD